MIINNIHEFDLNTEDEFVNIQNKLLNKICLKNSFDKQNIKLIAGVDLAYWEKENIQYGVCCIVVIDYNTKQILEKVNSYDVITTKYIAGFLAFRELPLVIEATKKLKLNPDIFMFDGNGYLHYRHMGIATHASFFLNKPTIGVAKSYLKINDYLYNMPDNEKGAFNDIVINNEVFGRVLRTHKDVNPIFVSCGNFIDLNTSIEIVNHFITNESRLPAPVRLADLETHIVRKQIKETD